MYSNWIQDQDSFVRPGMQHDILRRLRRGHWVVQAELDLHGWTRDEARMQVVRFLDGCIHQGLRCICVVHGKGLNSLAGQAVLKQLVPIWLVQRSEVLAFCHPQAAEGGDGVLVVLLKRVDSCVA